MHKSNEVNICVATTVHYALDTRIYFKQINTIKNKYLVDYFAQSSFKGELTVSGKYIALPEASSRLKRLKTLYYFFKQIRNSNYSIYIFHDPELWPIGLFLKIRKKTIILDLHENFSEQINNKEWIPYLIKKFLSILLSMLERKLPGLFDFLILAEDSYREKFDHKCTNIDVIHNYPSIQPAKKTEYDFNEFKMVYVGNIRVVRGIMEYLKILNIAVKNGLNVRLVLIGDFVSPSLYETVNQYIIENDLAEKVTCHGRLPNREIYKILLNCELGLALLHRIPNYILSYPTKIFEYMSVGLPCMASDFKLWDEVILDNDCGYTIDPLDVDGAFEIIKKYYHDINLIKRHGQNGLNTIKNKFNWQRESEKFLTIINKNLDSGFDSFA